MLYQEAKTVSSFNLAMMGAGIGLICGGCSLVGKRKTIKKKYDVPRIVAHRFLPLLRKARQLPSHHGQHHQRMRDASGHAMHRDASPSRATLTAPSPRSSFDGSEAEAQPSQLARGTSATWDKRGTSDSVTDVRPGERDGDNPFLSPARPDLKI